MSSLHITAHPKANLFIGKVGEKVLALAEEAVRTLIDSRDRITARAFIRGALAMLGEGVREMEHPAEVNAAGNMLDDEDFQDCCTNVEGMARKIKVSLEEKEVDSVVTYLKSIHRLLGNNAAAGGLTPRPRDYAAALSRFSEDNLNSPSRQRGPTQQERLEHTHSTTHL